MFFNSFQLCASAFICSQILYILWVVAQERTHGDICLGTVPRKEHYHGGQECASQNPTQVRIQIHSQLMPWKGPWLACILSLLKVMRFFTDAKIFSNTFN